MKAKYTLVNLKTNETKIVYIYKIDGKAVAKVDNQEYVEAPLGTIVEFNHSQKSVVQGIHFIDANGIKIIVESSNKYAAPQLIVEQDYKVKSNFFLNNMRVALPLFIVFVVVMVLLAILL